MATGPGEMLASKRTPGRSLAGGRPRVVDRSASLRRRLRAAAQTAALSLQESHQNGAGLLTRRQYSFEIGLRGFELALFLPARRSILGQRILNLRDRRFFLNSFLQGLPFGAGARPESAAWSARAAVRRRTTIRRRTAGTAESGRRAAETSETSRPHAAFACLASSIHHVLDQWLNGGPIFIVRNVQVFSNLLFHAL